MATKPFLLINKYYTMSLQYDPISHVNSNLAGLATTNAPGIDTNFDKSIYRRSFDMYGGDDEMNSFNNSGGSIIAAIASLFGNILNYFQQKKLLKLQQQYQYDYFDYTHSRQNAEYWKRVEYDTPARQMQRLKDAGLNENLLYGSLGNASQIAGNAPAASPGGIPGNLPSAMPFFDAGSVIQAFLQPSQVASQIALNNSQSYKNYKSAGVDEQQASRLSLLTPYEVEKYQQDINYVLYQSGKAIAEAESLDIDNRVKEASYSILLKIKEEELRYLRAQTFATREKGLYDHSAKLRMDKERDIVLPALARSYNASASEKYQNAARLEQTLESYKTEMSNRAKVSKEEAESYYYREVLPAYLDLGIDVASMLVTKGIKTAEINSRNAPRTKVHTNYNKKGNVTGSYTEYSH